MTPLASDLAVTVIDTPDPVTAGASLTYTLVITNYGPAVATGVVLTDVLPSEVTINNSGYAILLHLDEAQSPFLDTSGHNRNATCNATSGSCPASTSGRYGGALNFDGGNDNITTGISLGSISNNFSIETWIYPETTHQIDSESTGSMGGTAGQRYVFFPAWWAAGHAGAGISAGTNGISVYEHADNYMPALLVWQSPQSLQGWTHVVVVYNDKRPSLYVNGVPVRQGLTSSKSFVHPSVESIGGGPYGYFRGSLDQVAVYDRVLSDTEIAEHHNRVLRRVISASQGTCEVTSRARCDLGTLPAGSDAKVTIWVDVAPGALGTLTGTASVSAHESDLDLTNNQASTTTTVELPALPDLVVESVSVAPASAQPNQQVVLTAQIRNQGQGAAVGPFRTDWHVSPSVTPVSYTHLDVYKRQE